MSLASFQAPWLRTLHRHGGILVLGALLPWFSGCANTPASGAGPATSPKETNARPNPFEAVKKGMTAEQVRALVGKPEQIKPFKDGELHSEVWVYQRVISEEARMVAVTTQEIPVTNPLTGQTSLVAEPVMSHEFIKVSEITELLMIDGRLIEWKRKPQVDRTIQ